jgi:hypothetical protein
LFLPFIYYILVPHKSRNNSANIGNTLFEVIKMNKRKPDPTHQSENGEKTATNNQWVSTNMDHYPDNRERRDGPGGEDAD